MGLEGVEAGLCRSGIGKRVSEASLPQRRNARRNRGREEGRGGILESERMKRKEKRRKERKKKLR